MTKYLPYVLLIGLPLLAAYYAGRRLIAPSWFGVMRLLAWLTLLCGAAALPLMFFRPFGFLTVNRIAMLGLMYALGLLSIVVFFALAREVILMLGYWLGQWFARWQKRGGREQTYVAYERQQNRRLFLTESTRWGAWALSAGTFGRAALDVNDMSPTVVQTDVPIVDLPVGLQGLRIVQVSDLHIGQILHENRLVAAVVEAVNQLNADIVVLTGDMTDGKVVDLSTRAAPLAQLQAKYGRFFITGNHEYYSDKVENWLMFWAAQGYTVLENQHRVLTINNEPLVVAGVNDLRSGKRTNGQSVCSPPLALQGAPNAPTVLLAHHPDTAELTDGLRVDVQLSGHTHGGQYFPGTLFVRWVHQFKTGLNRYRNHWVYVNSGTGYWGPPLRSTTVLSEITVLTLKRARLESFPPSLLKNPATSI